MVSPWPTNQTFRKLSRPAGLSSPTPFRQASPLNSKSPDRIPTTVHASPSIHFLITDADLLNQSSSRRRGFFAAFLIVAAILSGIGILALFRTVARERELAERKETHSRRALKQRSSSHRPELFQSHNPGNRPQSTRANLPRSSHSKPGTGERHGSSAGGNGTPQNQTSSGRLSCLPAGRKPAVGT